MAELEELRAKMDEIPNGPSLSMGELARAIE